MLKIRVDGRKYIIIDRDGANERPVPNWSKYQYQAKTAVQQQSRPPHSGVYDCPGWLKSIVQTGR